MMNFGAGSKLGSKPIQRQISPYACSPDFPLPGVSFRPLKNGWSLPKIIVGHGPILISGPIRETPGRRHILSESRSLRILRPFGSRALRWRLGGGLQRVRGVCGVAGDEGLPPPFAPHGKKWEKMCPEVKTNNDFSWKAIGTQTNNHFSSEDMVRQVGNQPLATRVPMKDGFLLASWLGAWCDRTCLAPRMAVFFRSNSRICPYLPVWP